MSWIKDGIECNVCDKTQLFEVDTPREKQAATASSDGWRRILDGANDNETYRHECPTCASRRVSLVINT